MVWVWRLSAALLSVLALASLGADGLRALEAGDWAARDLGALWRAADLPGLNLVAGADALAPILDLPAFAALGAPAALCALMALIAGRAEARRRRRRFG